MKFTATLTVIPCVIAACWNNSFTSREASGIPSAIKSGCGELNSRLFRRRALRFAGEQIVALQRPPHARRIVIERYFGIELSTKQARQFVADNL